MTQSSDHHGERGPAVCEYCGRLLDEPAPHDVIVPDSSYLDPGDSRRDGHRPANACCREHADILVARGERLWDDEQLWAGKLSRVSAHWNRSETTLEGMASRAGLTYSQLVRAIRWRLGSGSRRQRAREPGGGGGRERSVEDPDHGHPVGLTPKASHRP